MNYFRMRSLSSVLAAVGLLGTVSLPAHAQSGGYDQSWYVAPNFSIFDPDNDYKIGGRGAGGGLRVGKQVAPNIDVQVMANQARRSESGNKIQQTLLGVDALYAFSRSSLQPYVFVGLGGERDKRSLRGIDTHGTSPYVNAGVGLRWLLTNNFSLLAEYRHVEGFLHDRSAWGFRHSSNDYLNFGLQWNFGEVQKPAPTPVAAPAPVAPPPPPKVEAAPPPPAKVVAAPPPPPQRITLQASRLFAFDNARLTPPIPELDTFAEAMNANPQVGNVRITGHTDQLGSAAYNRGLSQRRAESVKAYLVSKGVTASRLTAEGLAFSNPVKDCSGIRNHVQAVECGAVNRRVEVEPITVDKR